jgi:hypothetical protein
LSQTTHNAATGGGIAPAIAVFVFGKQGYYSAAENLALFWVAKFGDPEYRFESVDVVLEGLSDTQKIDVLQFELGDIVQMEFTPNGIGAPIERYGQIIGIKHTVSADRHVITFGLGSLQYSFLVLDDTGFGILDQNALAF